MVFGIGCLVVEFSCLGLWMLFIDRVFMEWVRIICCVGKSQGTDVKSMCKVVLCAIGSTCEFDEDASLSCNEENVIPCFNVYFY